MTSNPAWNIRWNKLVSRGDRLGVSCDEDGLRIGEVCLVERTDEGFVPRSAEELDFIFGPQANFAAKMSGLSAVARALDAGDLAKAMVATQFTQLPTLPNEGAARKAVIADALVKAGFNPDQPRDDHGMWTSDGSIGSADNPSAGFNPANVVPAQVLDTPVIPWLDEIPIPRPLPQTPPFPGDILPPLTDSPGATLPRDLTNPFPGDPECEKEWAKATKYCDELLRHRLMGNDKYRGVAPSYAQCLRGQVSERCGGNPVSRPRGRSSYDIMASG